MIETEVIVGRKQGLHARPASLFAKEAGKYDCELRIRHGDREANAKSILSILTLGINKGSEITISAEGVDAEDAIAALERLVESDFGDDEPA